MKKLFKCRCSEIGTIMTNDRSGKSMGKTVETFLQQWVKDELYGATRSIYSKYMEKGIQVELESIEYATAALGWGLCFKNDQHFENDFITGTPDLIFPGMVRDMKNSWDHLTFPLFEKDVPDKNNYWQMQGYMALTNLQKSEVVYVLMNTPEDLVYGEPVDYNDLPTHLRIKTFEIERNDADIDAIYRRVYECRNYINNLLTTIAQ